MAKRYLREKREGYKDDGEDPDSSNTRDSLDTGYPDNQPSPCSSSMIFSKSSEVGSPSMADSSQGSPSMLGSPSSFASSQWSPVDSPNEGLSEPARKKLKGLGVAGKSIEEELCLICGDRASGYHYNALSCEGCKGFFRRSITRSAKYVCKYGGNCEMDMWMRRRCQCCRLRRCREVGMKEECLLSDEQCKARDARRKARQAFQKRQVEELQQSPDSNSDSQCSSAAATSTSQTPATSNSQSSVPRESKDLKSEIKCHTPLEVISEDTKELIEKLVTYQDTYELPSEDDVKKVTQLKIDSNTRPKELSEAIFTQMAQITILVTQLIVEFSKHLPGFNSLEKEDQIVLLKGSACEVMVLRTARRYDIETDTVVFANGMPYTRNNLRFAGLQNYVDSMYEFCRGMGGLAVDNAEYALLTAVCIFSERPGLVNPRKVEALQEQYLNALSLYEDIKRTKSNQFLAKLLMKLTELRTLSAEHADVLFALKVERGSLPPLLNEYFDVRENVETSPSSSSEGLLEL